MSDPIEGDIFLMNGRIRPDVTDEATSRALRDSLHDASRPMLADLGNSTLLGVIGHPSADSARAVLAVRMLEPGGELGPWLFLGSGVRSGALAGKHASLAYAAWVEKDGDQPRVRLARIGRRAR